MIREIDLNALYKKAHAKLASETCQSQVIIPNSYIIKLTTDCNLRCQYCYMGDPTQTHSEISDVLFEHILDQIKKIRVSLPFICMVANPVCG
jgi:Predicted Fe-S oxidoreductases